MRFLKTLLILCVFLIMVSCLRTVGEIRDNTFYYEDNFYAGLLDDEWEVIRQQMRPGDPLFPNLYPARYSTSYQISFAHKKSSGFVGVSADQLSGVGKQRSVDVIADALISQFEGVKLSQKKVVVDGIEAIEVIQSSKKLMKLLIFKTDETAYYVVYTNTPTFFDQSLPVFDKFVSGIKIVKR